MTRSAVLGSARSPGRPVALPPPPSEETARVEHLLVARDEDDVRAFGDEHLRGRETEAARAPGDDEDAVAQAQVHAPIVPVRPR